MTNSRKDVARSNGRYYDDWRETWLLMAKSSMTPNSQNHDMHGRTACNVGSQWIAHPPSPVISTVRRLNYTCFTLTISTVISSTSIVKKPRSGSRSM